MDTQLTLADVRAQLYPEVNAANPNDPLFLQRLNEVRSRLIYNGKWKGSLMTLNFPATQGFITLPRDYAAVLVMRYRCIPRMVFTQFLPFSASGPGYMDEAKRFPGVMVDMGDGFVTQSDITTTGTLRITVTDAADASKIIRLYGRDQNDNEIYDATGVAGINVTTAAPSVTTTQQFSKVTGIQAPPNMTHLWTLSVVNGAVATQLGAYQPGETRPSYRRYQTGETRDTIQTICQRRFIPVVNETDWVIPGNMSALRMGLQSMSSEFANQQDIADQKQARAIDFLNDEARAFRGGAIPTLNFHTEMSWGVQIGS